MTRVDLRLIAERLTEAVCEGAAGERAAKGAQEHRADHGALRQPTAAGGEAPWPQMWLDMR